MKGFALVAAILSLQVAFLSSIAVTPSVAAASATLARIDAAAAAREVPQAVVVEDDIVVRTTPSVDLTARAF